MQCVSKFQGHYVECGRLIYDAAVGVSEVNASLVVIVHRESVATVLNKSGQVSIQEVHFRHKGRAAIPAVSNSSVRDGNA